jgi:2-polyprenyl-3-methyl-5-hydroxy-6-metoxy-1,4-benzoquinol methylase
MVRVMPTQSGKSLANIAAPSQPRQDCAVPSNQRPDWEAPACLLCGGRRHSLFVRAPDNSVPWRDDRFSVVRCHDCGLCFTSPRPTPNAIDDYYGEGYAPHQPRPLGREPSWHARLAAWCGWPHSPRRGIPVIGRARLLDFGCGGGSYLERMHRLGWVVTGLDKSAEAVEYIRARLGLRALEGTLPHHELAEGSFDLITMWHALEHVHEPLTVLREAHRLLAPGGRLLVATPNIDSLPFRWFGRAWFGLDLPRHLTHFTPLTLRLMLEQAGFRCGRIRMVRHSRWLRRSAQLACDRSTPRTWQRWLTGMFASRVLSRFSALTRQSDCILMTARRQAQARIDGPFRCGD